MVERKRSVTDPKMVLASAGRELETPFVRRDTETGVQESRDMRNVLSRGKTFYSIISLFEEGQMQSLKTSRLRKGCRNAVVQR